ncbi:MAG: LPS export ABC transporter periplasmic protein LptC [Prevotella sp.]|jgi:LPS export ABC transporter protein LptC|nr:LPS export ABC transporter periplasmic protein LptC [Prevotella sp.]
MQSKRLHIRYSWGAAFVLVLLSVMGCSEEAKEHTAAAIHDRDSVSMMTSYGVNTLISDSGVIKYRIVTERWDVNVIRQPNRWEFMKGVFFEQFDEQFHVQAYIQADTAWYYDKQKLWKLRGRVRIRNINGLNYMSEELYWDGIRHEFYSNVFSQVITPERSLQGTYFRSDEHMMNYTVSNSKGSFIPDENKEDETAGSTTPADTTTQQTQAPIRPAAQKHAKTVE